MERGLDERSALWSVVLGSVGSAAGRLLMPMLSDKNWPQADGYDLVCGLAGAECRLLVCTGVAVVAVYAGLTFCYSALAAVLPALSTDLFGFPHAGVNYGFLALGQSVGSLAFPLMANLWGRGAGAGTSLPLAGAVGGFVAIWALRPVQPPRAPRPN